MILPSQPRLLGVVTIREERLRWIRGYMTRYPEIEVEISFEAFPGGATLPGTHITYFGMWGRGPKATVFEFQLGVIAKVPSADAYSRHVRPIIDRLQSYLPPQVI